MGKQPYPEPLYTTAHKFSFACQVIGIISEALVIFATFALIAHLLYKRKTSRELPIRVKLSLIVQALYAPFFTCILIVNLEKNPFWGMFLWYRSNNHSAKIHIVDIIARTVWTCLQWQFTAYYLQTACLFRITFRAQCDADFEKVRVRKFWLYIIEFSVMAVFVITMIIGIFATIGQGYGKLEW